MSQYDHKRSKDHRITFGVFFECSDLFLLDSVCRLFLDLAEDLHELELLEDELESVDVELELSSDDPELECGDTGCLVVEEPTDIGDASVLLDLWDMPMALMGEQDLSAMSIRAGLSFFAAKDM